MTKISSHNTIRVFVLNKHKKPLMPCHPARARRLLSDKKAKLFRRYPFTIILINETTNFTQPIEFKTDPGSKTTGIALVGIFPKQGNLLIWAANLHHRGQKIVNALTSRRNLRSGRRNRKTRYRPPRWNNRKNKYKGWLPPSLRSRIYNVAYLCRKIMTRCPITNIVIETVRFDTQLLQDSTISGVEYQQGTLQGYEVREYLLEKFQRACVYCGITNVPLQIEHIIPKSRGGSNRISNLTLSCRNCNTRKGTKTASEFGYPGVQSLAKKPLKDAAVVNATRYAIRDILKLSNLPVEISSGGVTKCNRIKLGLRKDHWIDAACTGNSGSSLVINTIKPCILNIKATGRGHRQVQSTDKYGFPRKKKSGEVIAARKHKRIRGFQTGDLVKLDLPDHVSMYAGVYIERLASISTKGQFEIYFDGVRINANWRYFKLLQRSDGYEYVIN